MNDQIEIRGFLKRDINNMSEAFRKIFWDKLMFFFEEYLKETELNEQSVWMAYIYNQSTILNRLPIFRKIGIVSLLLDGAEKKAVIRSKIIGIGVGLYSGKDGGYGSTQRICLKSGYIPDSKGFTYNYAISADISFLL